MAYALMSRAAAAPLSPGLWRFNLAAEQRGLVRWAEVVGESNTIWPHHYTTWTDFLLVTDDDLSELSIVRGTSGGPDEIFVGAGRNGWDPESFGLAGYFRYGEYRDNGLRTGWIHIQRTPDSSLGNTNPIIVANWKGAGVVADTLLIESMGWYSFFPLLQALVPYAVHPGNDSLMVAVNYDIPLLTANGGGDWTNLYCTGTSASAGWTNRGLNLMGATSSTVLPDGTLVMGALDYGGFYSVDPPVNRSYVPLHDLTHGTPPKWPKGVDVETVRFNGVHEIYMVDGNGREGANDRGGIWLWNESLGKLHDISTSPSSDLATVVRDSAGASSAAAVVITDIAFADSARVFAAAAASVVVAGGSSEQHFFICEGSRTGDTTWNWSVRHNAHRRVGGTKVINRMCLIPGTTKLVYGAMSKWCVGNVTSDGGLYCLDHSTGVVQQWLPGGSDQTLVRLSRNVTSVAVDRTGQYVYAGSSGYFTPYSTGRGGVVRWRLVDGVPGEPEVLAGAEDTFGLGTPVNYPSGTPNAGWEYSTKISDIEVDPYNPKVVYVSLGNGSYFHSRFGAWCYSGDSWQHICGGYETGSGAATVAIHPGSPGSSSTLYVGTRAQEFFATPISLSTPNFPAIADSAEYPLLAGTSGATLVFAVRIAATGGIQEATVDLTGIGLVDSVLALRDDGQDQDIASGDGIFTSRKFATTLAESNSQTVRVFAEATRGGYVREDVVVEVVASNAKFEDVTASTGELATILTEQPYSAVYFKSVPGDPASGELMVVTFDSDENAIAAQPPQILQHAGYSGGAPLFANRTSTWFGLGGMDAGGRGVCYADYDNDGDNDFFICNPVHGGKLYRNDLPAGFSNVTTDLFGADVSTLAQAVAASWGDYNSDGFIDLFVSTTSYFGSVQQLTAMTLSGTGSGIDYSVMVFRNIGGAALQKTLWGDRSSMNACLSGCWADLDNDRDLDLITTRFIDGAIRVMENLGFSYSYGDNLVGAYGWRMTPGAEDRFGANSVMVMDYNHDPYPDLLITYATHDGNPKVKILRNNYGTDQSKEFTPIDLVAGTEWNGATIADFDLNGHEDILLLPRTSSVPPALFMASGAGATPTYRDFGFTVGLRGGATGGGLAVDFDGERNIDLYMGRADSTRVLYRNVGQASASTNWVGVQLGTRGNSNGSLIGTKVTVEASGRRWTRFVDGGSGRGGQSANRLLIGLGDAAGAVSIRVRYPSGDADSLLSVSANQVYLFEEDSAVVLYAGSKSNPEPDFDYELQPGAVDWVFRWRTISSKGDVRQDKVEVHNYSNYVPDGNCGVGIAPGASRFLQWGNPDTEFLVYWDGSQWQHEVHWTTLPCGVNCEYRFRVTSGIAGQLSQSGWRTMTTTSFCVPDEDDPNQQ